MASEGLYVCPLVSIGPVNRKPCVCVHEVVPDMFLRWEVTPDMHTHVHKPGCVGDAHLCLVIPSALSVCLTLGYAALRVQRVRMCPL